jgi:ubiquinone/menaquinone biosynthesis C-methylase UbiE
MSEQPAWQWNEFQQIGTDYTDAAEVARYDKRMGQFRDLEAEDAAILKELSLPQGAHVLEIGTGTGHFALAAARAGHCVTAVDVSRTMLQYARSKAEAESLYDIDFVHAGFLMLPFADRTFDGAVSVVAMHHLPDLWKAVALQNLRRMMKPGAGLVLRDVVFSWQGDDYAACFDGFVNSCPEGMRTEVVRHIAKEYSTLSWIMEGLLERAGFRVMQKTAARAYLMNYLCHVD